MLNINQNLTNEERIKQLEAAFEDLILLIVDKNAWEEAQVILWGTRCKTCFELEQNCIQACPGNPINQKKEKQ